MHKNNVFFNTESETTNIWYVSDTGSDNNDCHLESAPCRNLQTILDRAKDGADVYVTSNFLSLNMKLGYVWTEHPDYGPGYYSGCTVKSTISYTLLSRNNNHFKIICPGKFQDFNDSFRIQNGWSRIGNTVSVI